MLIYGEIYLSTESRESLVVLEVDGLSTSAGSTRSTSAVTTGSTVTTAGSTTGSTITTTATTATTGSAVTTTSRLVEAHVDVENLLLLTLASASLVLGFAGEVLGLLLGKLLGVGPLLVLGSVGRLADFRLATKLGLLFLELGEVLLVSLDLGALLLSGGLRGVGSSGVRVGGVGTSGVLLGELSAGKLILPLAVALGGAPSLIGLLRVLPFPEVSVMSCSSDFVGNIRLSSLAVTVELTTATASTTGTTVTTLSRSLAGSAVDVAVTTSLAVTECYMIPSEMAVENSFKPLTYPARYRCGGCSGDGEHWRPESGPRPSSWKRRWPSRPRGGPSWGHHCLMGGRCLNVVTSVRFWP